MKREALLCNSTNQVCDIAEFLRGSQLFFDVLSAGHVFFALRMNYSKTKNSMKCYSAGYSTSQRAIKCYIIIFYLYID